MKNRLEISLLTLLLTGGIPLCQAAAPAAQTKAPPAPATPQLVEQARVVDGKLMALAGGQTFSPTNTVALPNEILVTTNLTFTVAGGRPRKLTEGQVLSKDGTLQSPDGTLLPVVDHVAQKNGKLVVYKDGVAREISGLTKLDDGSTVLADGTYVDKSGRRTRLLDGQQLKLDGSAFPATDTATLSGGKVVVQKDGSQMTLRPSQSIMMADGTKVIGNGTVISKDGKTSQLKEGQILKIEGVRRR